MRLLGALAAIRPASSLHALRAALIGIPLLIGVLLGGLVVADRAAGGTASPTATHQYHEASPEVDSNGGRSWGKLGSRLSAHLAVRPRFVARRSGAPAATTHRPGPATVWSGGAAHRGPATDHHCDPAVLQIYRC
ncbi:hypothetical protein GCM10010124_13700 [Pilimelia terevasa]|uniref:Uncharacterized protein n=1 Tax=Pilimelia terevasa TaxID=53372 RepID=A0A8J3BL91_9ACTN|nr:hypothetical protein [Pilimelia terevasa]GGK22457.1 hypothetical protein GCM10010124_13700 [Pilimelia terevasa]